MTGLAGAPGDGADGGADDGAATGNEGAATGGDGATRAATQAATRAVLTGRDADAVDRLRDFAATHGSPRAGEGGDGAGSGECVAVIEHLGRVGARIVAIAAGGEFGDALVSSVEVARIVCERAGLDVREWDRELTARVTPTPADRVRMGGHTH